MANRHYVKCRHTYYRRRLHIYRLKTIIIADDLATGRKFITTTIMQMEMDTTELLLHIMLQKSR